jgi:hypothetical protein
MNGITSIVVAVCSSPIVLGIQNIVVCLKASIKHGWLSTVYMFDRSYYTVQSSLSMWCRSQPSIMEMYEQMHMATLRILENSIYNEGRQSIWEVYHTLLNWTAPGSIRNVSSHLVISRCEPWLTGEQRHVCFIGEWLTVWRVSQYHYMTVYRPHTVRPDRWIQNNLRWWRAQCNPILCAACSHALCG